ncbi:related to wee1 kinase [Ustilago trichophora]|uniref:Related to wee1 kinase n=1 Tax=Ustilago trichophora TaxID=86804 RepID=A0A5C3E7R3_9BASI|nr:related to wee1 kinase [Ustilago trichophora]
MMDHTDDSFISPNKPSRSLAASTCTFTTAYHDPPPNFGSHIYHKSPFASWIHNLPDVPATEVRPQTVSIPRSHAFSSLAPLSKLSPTQECHAMTWMPNNNHLDMPFASIKRTILSSISSFRKSPSIPPQPPCSCAGRSWLWHHRGISNGSGSDPDLLDPSSAFNLDLGEPMLQPEFLTPRSASASAGLGDKLPGVANLFEFATQPRPSSVPLIETRRHSFTRRKEKASQLSMSSSPQPSSSRTRLRPQPSLLPTEQTQAQQQSSRLQSDSLDHLSTPARPTGVPLRAFGSEASASYMETPQYATPHRLFGSVHSNNAADDSGVAFADGIRASRAIGREWVPLCSHIQGLARALGTRQCPRRPFLALSGCPSTPRDQLPPRLPAPRPSSRIVMHAFGLKRVFSHARDRFNSSDNGSANSSPDPIHVCDPGPAWRAREARARTQADVGIYGPTSQYLTPQNFKSVKPLQAAFIWGSDAFPLPPKPPNFGHALGLREVVAAASAHASATADRTSNAMPDTPVKKATSTPLVPFPSLPLSSWSDGFQPVGSRTFAARSTFSRQGLSLVNVNTGSPVLPDSCDSPTLNLINLGTANASTPAALSARHGVAFGNLPRSRRSPNPDAPTCRHLAPSVQSGRIRDVHRLQKGKRTITTPSSGGSHAPSRKMLSVDTGKAAGAPKTLRVRSAGLGKRTMSRNASFVEMLHRCCRHKERAGSGAGADSEALPPSTPLTSTVELLPGEEDMAPMTPPATEHRSSGSRRRRSLQRHRHLPDVKLRRSCVLIDSSSCRPAANRVSRKHRLAKTPQKGSAAASAFSTSESSSSSPSMDLRANQAHEPGHLEKAFAVEETIGSGEFSEVLKAVSRTTGYAYAIKRMKKAYTGPRDRLRRLEEVHVLRALSASGKPHPNVVSLFGAWEEEEEGNRHLYLQFELCPLGSLAFFLEEYGQQVGALDEPRCGRFWQSCQVAWLTSIATTFALDLKPANVLITEHGTLKIGDFGMATRWPLVDAETTLKGARLDQNRTSMLWTIMAKASSRRFLRCRSELLEWAFLRILGSLLSSDPEQRASMDEIVALPTMVCVRSIMSRGLSASEMDQLPEFTDSVSTSGSSSLAVMADSSSMCLIRSDVSSSRGGGNNMLGLSSDSETSGGTDSSEEE